VPCVRSIPRRALVRVSQWLRPALPHDAFRALYGLGKLGYLPDYRNPRTFNEKAVAWLRSTRDPKLVERADKLAVRDHVREVAPWLALPEVYAVSADAAAFPFDALPDVSVLKANHGWSQVRVLRRPFDEAAARTTGAAWLAQRHGDERWEWHFRAIPPRLYAEAYLGDAEGRPPVDYKLLVIGGRVAFVQCFIGRGVRLRRVMFDRDWRVLEVYRPRYPGGPPDVVEPALRPPRPACLDAMIAGAETLGAEVPLVRVDLYVVDGAPYFGELTFLPAEGYVPFWPESYDRTLGDAVPWPPGSPAPPTASRRGQGAPRPASRA